jgi:hypothetical protein
MISESVSHYITERYPRWRDYAEYQAARAGIPEDAGDILGEVMLSLLQKNSKDLDRLLRRKKKSFTKDETYSELDYFVLKMIKLNATSVTAPWRFKTKNPPVDENADIPRLRARYSTGEDPEPEEEIEELHIEDPDQEEEADPTEIHLSMWTKARDILDSLDVSDHEKKIFAWKVFADNPLNSWPGPESYTTACYRFNRVKERVSYLARISNEDQVSRLSLRLLKACINERNEELRSQDLRIRKLACALLSVKPVLQGVA